MRTKSILFGIGVLAAMVMAGVIIAVIVVQTKPDEPSEKQVKVSITEDSTMIITRNGDEILKAQLGTLFDMDPTKCENLGDLESCQEWSNIAKLEVAREEIDEITCFNHFWQTFSDVRIMDCFDFGSSHWYGGAEMFYQRWPIEEWNKTMENYVSGDLYKDEYGSLLERYWLSSMGVAIRVSHDSPLHLSVNPDGTKQFCFLSTYDDSYYPNPDNRFPLLEYTVCSGSDIRHVHEYMTDKYVQKPSSWPDERMIKSPIWSTWAKYKIFINESEILQYARDIRDNGFNNSQLEIDDGFQLKYGDFDFDPDKFANVSGMVDQLHEWGFRVTLWVTPFANINSDAYKEGNSNGYWVKDGTGKSGLVLWWNGLGAMLDVTKPEANDWFVNRLEQVRTELGFDSFKFDAGETNYLATNFQTYSPIVNPCEYTTKYVETVARLGNQIEVRAAFENQNQPVFVRMMDKASQWGWNNGLKTIITTALTFNLLGYPYVLPDMIGGNVYEAGFHSTLLPDRSLFIRWLQLTAFLPSMQYSISPWQYDDEVVQIALRWTAFHENVITPILLRIIQEEVITEGKMLNRPLWWIAPNDKEALRSDTQFLVGDEILVAPIVDDGATSRDVYLPQGQWYDNLHETIITGGKWIRDVNVPLEEILYYTRQ